MVHLLAHAFLQMHEIKHKHIVLCFDDLGCRLNEWLRFWISRWKKEIKKSQEKHSETPWRHHHPHHHNHMHQLVAEIQARRKLSRRLWKPSRTFRYYYIRTPISLPITSCGWPIAITHGARGYSWFALSPTSWNSFAGRCERFPVVFRRKFSQTCMFIAANCNCECWLKNLFTKRVQTRTQWWFTFR